MHLRKQAPSPISLKMDRDRSQLKPLLLLDGAELEWWLSRFLRPNRDHVVYLLYIGKLTPHSAALDDCMFGGRMRAKEKTLSNKHVRNHHETRMSYWAARKKQKKTHVKKKKNESMYDVRSGACCTYLIPGT